MGVITWIFWKIKFDRNILISRSKFVRNKGCFTLRHTALVFLSYGLILSDLILLEFAHMPYFLEQYIVFYSFS